MLQKHKIEDFNNLLSSNISVRINSAENIINAYGLRKKINEFRKVNNLLYTSPNEIDAQVTFQAAGELLLKSIENYLYPPDYSTLNVIALNELLWDECSFQEPRLDIIDKLQCAGANIFALDEWNETAFEKALKLFQYPNILEYLLNLGVDPNFPFLPKNHHPANYYFTLWHSALNSNCSEDTLRIFLKYGANLKDEDFEGNNALLFSAKNNKIGVSFYEYLINEGFDPNHKNNKGETALHILEYNLFSKKDIAYDKMEILLKKGANPNQKNELGNSVLHQSCNRIEPYTLDSCKLLLKYNASPNLRNALGNTPIMSALLNKNLSLLELLISFGADTEIKNLEGLNAYELALKHGLEEEAKLLNPCLYESFKNNTEFQALIAMKKKIIEAIKLGKSWKLTDNIFSRRIFYKDGSFQYGTRLEDSDYEHIDIIEELEILKLALHFQNFDLKNMSEFDKYNSIFEQLI